MSDNQTLIQKADVALADLASGGKLQPEQADKFIRRVLDATPLIKAVRRVILSKPERKIPRIVLADRILRPGVQGTALIESERSKPTLSQIEISTKEVIAEVRLPYDFLEDNIESANVAAAAGSSAGGIMDTLRDMIADRVSMDLEELGIMGDTGSGDAYLAMLDGWVKRCTSNVVDADGDGISKDVFKALKLALPVKYQNNIAALKFLMNNSQETEYRSLIADRQTGLGDAAIQSSNGMQPFGSTLSPVPRMPVGTGLFGNPLNLIFAIWREVMMEFDKNIQTREFIIVVTARVGFQVEEVEAMAKVINLATPV